MKKTLILVRHATAEDQDFGIKDFDRQLVDRGLSEAAIMGKWLSDTGISPDLFITSQASRAQQTAEVMATQLHYKASDIVSFRSLYDGGPQSYLSSINSIAEPTDKLILFGHNPDITYFGEYLSGKILGSMKKCSIVMIEFDGLKWEEISADTGNFISYITPKEVKGAS